MTIFIFPKGTSIPKRIFDLALTLPLLIVFLPLMAIIALVILVFDGTPVTFKQERPGYRGRIFKVIKFRTMKDLRDEQDKLLTDEKRVSRLGQFLRATSLDELPELLNVLTGDMSLVGPRPLLVCYLERYNPEQARRHDVAPGITGWAQINGRNALTWDEKFKLDVWYVDHQSLALDLKILFSTIWKVIKREGISPPDHMVMDEFMGNNNP